MKRIFPITAVVLTLSLMATTAHAACTVQYKAKRDNPLKLFHSTAVVPGPCDRGTVRAQLSAQLAAQGLTLLKILSVKG